MGERSHFSSDIARGREVGTPNGVPGYTGDLHVRNSDLSNFHDKVGPLVDQREPMMVRRHSNTYSTVVPQGKAVIDKDVHRDRSETVGATVR